MSIKCSLLGHRFGETEVERDRAEDGTEVVITITELETCTRCGETRVVSENKEVTTLEAPGAGPADVGDVPGPDAGSAVSGVDGTARADDAAFVDAGGDPSAAPADAGGADATIPDAESGSVAGSAAEAGDDAVIMEGASEAGDAASGATSGDDVAVGDDSASDVGSTGAAGSDGTDGDDGDRAPGEWPDDSDVTAAERAGESVEVEILENRSAGAGAGPDDTPENGDGSTEGRSGASDPGAVDERAGAVGGATNAGTVDGSDVREGAQVADAAGVAGSGGAWPDDREGVDLTGEDAMGEWPEETKRDEPADSGLVNAELDDDAGAITVPEGMFKCSTCGFETAVESSSLRAGDFCPECRRGTLVQREDADEE